MSKIIYLDNNATTQVDKRVEKVTRVWQTNFYANPSSLHFFGQKIFEAITLSRKKIAEVINSKPDEVFFTASGSEGNNLCIKGYCEANKDKGKHIITSSIEHPSVINTCKHLEEQGFEVTYLPVDSRGFILAEDLNKAIRPNTILVSIMHANNEIGTIQDIVSFVKICNQHNIPLHTDAVQSFLKLSIDVEKLGIAMATFSGHKIHAPKGIGFIFKRKDIKIKRQIDGGGQEFGFRSGTENTPYIIGLNEAIQIFSQKDVRNMKNLQDYFIKELMKINSIHLNGPEDLTKRICNNINFSVANMEGEYLLNQLSRRKICISTGSACSSKSTKISPVLKAINCPTEYIHGNLRASLSKFTTKREIVIFLKELKNILKQNINSLKEV